MAKKEIRVLKASEVGLPEGEQADLGKMVDRGAEVDAELKGLAAEDKGLKGKIAELVAPKLETHETSLRVTGETGAAVVTAADSFQLNPAAERYAEVVAALDAGRLGGMVERKKVLVVDSMDADRAAEVLVAAGVQAKVEVATKVDAEAVREAEKRQTTADEAAVMASVTRDTTYRVKYEKLKKG